MTRRSRYQNPARMGVKERQAYYQFARTRGGEDTNPNDDKHTLSGSEETPYTDINALENRPKVADKSFKAKLRDNWNTILKWVFGVLLIPLVFYIASLYGELNSEIKYANKMIDFYGDKIASIETDFITKEFLDMKLDVLMLEVSALIPDIAKIEKHLEEIDEILDAGKVI